MTGLARSPRRLGILGGMGPEATVLLMSRIIAATDASDDCDHVPMIVDNNTQVPSRIRALIEGDGEDPGPTLAEMARKLTECGAEALIMPCNTAHNFADTIRAAANIPFIDMIEETASTLASMPEQPKTVGVLASPAVRITGVLDRALEPHGLSTIYPTDDDSVLSIIRMIKANGPSESATALLTEAATALERSGVDVILVGCTEFSLLTNRLRTKAPVIDTLDVLVDRAVAFALADQSAATASQPAQATA